MKVFQKYQKINKIYFKTQGICDIFFRKILEVKNLWKFTTNFFLTDQNSKYRRNEQSYINEYLEHKNK